MSTPDLHPNRMSNMRRSQRVCLSIPVLVIKNEPSKPAITEESHTLIVSAHGALVVLKMTVKFGDVLKIKHKKTEEELACRVMNFGAEQGGKKEVGVEFEQAAPRFWRIAFPPADWSPRGPDSKPPQAPGSRPVARKPVPVPAETVKTPPAKSPGPAQR